MTDEGKYRNYRYYRSKENFFSKHLLLIRVTWVQRFVAAGLQSGPGTIVPRCP